MVKSKLVWSAVAVMLLVINTVFATARAQGTGAQINEATVSVELYVDQSNPAATDSNPGTQALPLLTIGAAVAKARSSTPGGTKIEIGPGIYRESITLGNFSNSNPSPLILEASDPGATVVSGADLWNSGWQAQSNGTFTHPWLYSWGNAATPSGWPTLQPIVRRREMVIINGTPLAQKTSLSLTQPGTFFVADGSMITLKPPTGTDMTSATIEVATRAGLLQTPNGISNLVLRGLTFVYDSSAVNAVGNGAVKLVGGSNLLVDNCVFNHNNWLGLSVSGNPAQNVTITNSLADQNGENGVALSKLKNLFYDNDQTSTNNWRGAAGGFTDFDADGIKVTRIHDGTFSNSVSAYNQTGGIWFDTDNANVLIENYELCGNLTNGMFVEASQGPVGVQDSLILGNGSNGFQMANSTNVSLSDNTAYGNAKGAVFIGGSDTPRSVTDFETSQQYSLYSQSFSQTGNIVAGSSSQATVLNSSLSTSWALFAQSLLSDFNTWFDQFNGSAFQTKFGRQNLGGWRVSSQQDADSTWTDPNVVLPTSCGVADPPPLIASPTPAPSATPTPTASPTPTVVPTPTPTATPTGSPTPTPTSTPTATPTPIGSSGLDLVTPATINFSRITVGTTSSVRTVLVMNPFGSSSSIVIGSASLVGSSGFALVPASTTCTPGHTLAPDAQCQVAVKYTATALGTESATLTVIDSATASPHVISLLGTGI